MSGTVSNLGGKPQSLTIAVNLLWASLAVGVLKVATTFIIPGLRNPNVSPGFALTILLFVLGVFVLLVWKISIGRNWARITFLILTILGAYPSLRFLSHEFAMSPMYGAASLVQIGLQLCAIVLLFVKPASDWFRARAV